MLRGEKRPNLVRLHKLAIAIASGTVLLCNRPQGLGSLWEHRLLAGALLHRCL